MCIPKRWSDVEHESMKVCATTDKHESTMFDLWISKTKFGFLIKLTQNLKFSIIKILNNAIILFITLMVNCCFSMYEQLQDQ